MAEIEKTASRRAVVKGSLIALGAGLLLQAKGGFAQDTEKKDDKKKKGEGKKKEDTTEKK
jgi:hypothetical protein